MDWPDGGLNLALDGMACQKDLTVRQSRRTGLRWNRHRRGVKYVA